MPPRRTPPPSAQPTRSEVRTPQGTPLTVSSPPADDPPRGGVVVVQDARGITPYLGGVADALATGGWLAVAPHLYHRDGFAEVESAGSWPTAATTMTTLTAPGITADVDAAASYLSSAGIPPERTAIIGFCMGGTVALHTATRRRLAAAVSFYGGGVSTPYWDGIPPLLELAPSLRAPWLGLYGEADALIRPDEIASLRAAAGQADVPTELISYPGAGHAFHSADRPATHNPEAGTDAWQRMLTFLEQHASGQ